MNEKAKKNLDRYKAALQRVREDRDLNAAARLRLMGEAYSKASSTHEQLVEEDRQRVADAYDNASRSVFGAPIPHAVPGAERAAVQTSYRDAMFRVSQIGREDSDELHRVQRMAAATGDKLLQRAILYRGYELENRSVVEAVSQADPALGRSWEAFMDAAEKVNRAESDPFRYAGPDAPPELDGLPTTEAG